MKTIKVPLKWQILEEEDTDSKNNYQKEKQLDLPNDTTLNKYHSPQAKRQEVLA